MFFIHDYHRFSFLAHSQLKLKTSDSSLEAQFIVIYLGLFKMRKLRVIGEVREDIVICDGMAHILKQLFFLLTKSRVIVTWEQTTEIIEADQFFLLHLFLSFTIIDRKRFNYLLTSLFTNILAQHSFIKLPQLGCRHYWVLVVSDNVYYGCFWVVGLNFVLWTILFEYSS
mgnify:CR=1 FL=1